MLKIYGTGSSVPKQTITNDDLTKIMDTNDEWITTRTGISERHILNSENEPRGLLTIAVEACFRAVEDSAIDAARIDMVICSTLHGEYITPAMSCLIAKELGLPTTARVIDVNMGCSGFIYALDMAEAYLDSGKASNIIIVCAEALSRCVDWTDRSSCILFGDAAAAVVVGRGEGLVDIKLTSDGNAEILHQPHIDTNCPYSGENGEPHYLTLNGQEVYKFAVTSIYNNILEILSKNQIDIETVKYFLLHQANIRIINSALGKLKQPAEKFPSNIDRYGNTSSATIPLLLDELRRAGKIACGDLLVLDAFGSGLSTAVCVLRF
jgi:3-oxoacyl-[acyl-carrier-protein] synthase-3